MKVTLEWSVELLDGTEVMYDIELDVTPGTRDTFEEQGWSAEIEIQSIMLQGIGKQPGIEVKEVLWKALGFSKEVIERIEEAAVEKASDKSVNDDPPDPRED
jgi:hypothetical protein